MSQGSMGVPKAPEHKAKIAAGQRRRHSAVRVLTAVEAFHRGNQLDSPNESGAEPSQLLLRLPHPLPSPPPANHSLEILFSAIYISNQTEKTSRQR